jgi:transposase-like protein
MIDRKANRTYTIEEKSATVALALSIGPLRAAKQLGIPPRTVAAWTSGERSAKTLGPVVTATRQQAADRLWETLQRATDAVEDGLKDPRQRLGDRARALEVLVHAHELIAGRATENVAMQVAPAESVVDMLALSDEQRHDLANMLRQAIDMRETLERLSPGLGDQMDAEATALTAKWKRIAEGREVPLLGPGAPLLGSGIIEGEEDAPLTPAERSQLETWLQAIGYDGAAISGETSD